MSKQKVLVAGCNGYIGNALVQKLLMSGYYVHGIDNDIKYKWTAELGSEPIIPVKSINEKISLFNKIGPFAFTRMDVAKEPNEVKRILSKNDFMAVINLAQQPSAAFSHISLKAATETLNNNIIGTLNFLWAISKFRPDTHYIEIESMGTNNPAMGFDHPEGYFKPIGKRSDYPAIVEGPQSIFPKAPGSLYHASKVMNTYLVDCAYRWWNLRITAINQGVVYGNGTAEIQETGIHSPLWVDECFGTVVNRFIAQALLDIPLTIYGGDQRRGFIGLNDSIQAVTLLMENPPDKTGVRFVNQIDEIFSIKEIADKISVNQIVIASPRVENTEKFYYNPVIDTLRDLGFQKTTNIDAEIDWIQCFVDRYKLELMRPLLQSPKVRW
jgi:nucleoside-diphosphate-sugar epimerase